MQSALRGMRAGRAVAGGSLRSSRAPAGMAARLCAAALLLLAAVAQAQYQSSQYYPAQVGLWADLTLLQAGQ